MPRAPNAVKLREAADNFLTKYPLAVALQETFRPTRRKVEKPRISVVSEELCDDTLELLRPSLEKHKGCRIIDFFPGAGLWSRKVHEIINPCSHTLVEPDSKFHEFLRPLADRPGSTMNLVSNPQTSSLESLPAYVDIFNETLDHVEPGDEFGGRGTNDSVLIMATLSKDFSRHTKADPTKSISINNSPSEPWIWSFLNAAIHSNVPHTNGPVRMLVWTWDRDKFNILPRLISGRKSTAMALEESFTVDEIVGSSEAPAFVRPIQLDIRSAIGTAKRMEKSGITVPEQRLPLLHKAILNSKHPKAAREDGVHSASSTEVEFDVLQAVEELDVLELAYFNGEFERNAAIEKGADKRFKLMSQPFARMTAIRANLDALVRSTKGPLTVLESANGTAYKLWLLIKAERQFEANRTGVEAADKQAVEVARAEMDARLLDVQKDLAQIKAPQKRSIVQNAFENMVAFDTKMLSWDRRDFEPLECEAEEFYPPHRMTLLDIQPKNVMMETAPNHPIYDHIFYRVLKHHFNLPVPTAVENIAHGASAALLPECPSIHDPLKGGRIHLEYFRVKMLTLQMWKELIAAYEKWPLKPSEERLIAQVGNSTVFTDFDNGTG